MFRDAAKEVRLHPGRVVATLVAIAISVGFMAAVSIFVTTQSSSIGKQASLATSKADVVAAVATPKQGVTTQKLVQTAKAVPGVAAVEPTQTMDVGLSTDAGNVYVALYRLPSEQFRWASLTEGSWPSAMTDVVISKQAADKLKVHAGGTVDIGEQKLTVTGISNEPASLFFQTGYASPALFDKMEQSGASTSLLVKVTDRSDEGTVVQKLHDALAPLVDRPDVVEQGNTLANLSVTTSEQAQNDAVKGMAGNFDVMKYVLWVFSGIAALVGMIIISNTFTILLAQRRRQIGLLRAVGATGGQVRGRFLAEAVLLGLLGSVLGVLLGAAVAAIGAQYTHALYWGLSLPWPDLVVEVLVGILLTVLAAMLPSLKATRVAPLEALQPVQTSEQARKASRVRLVVCGLLVLVGLGLALASLDAPISPVFTGPVVRAMVGAMLVAVGVLFGAPLYIPMVLRGLGRIFGLFGATPRLAASNAVRNPRRASATATALMLACGLIVTLQVGTATAEKTALTEIAHKYPVDLTVSRIAVTPNGSTQQGTTELTPSILAKLDTVPDVAKRVTFLGGPVESDNTSGYVGSVAALTPEAHALASVVPATIADDQVMLSPDTKAGTKVTLRRSGGGQSVTLTAVTCNALQSGESLVSPNTLKKLVASPTPQLQWIKLSTVDDLGTVMAPVQRLARSDQGLNIGGSAAMSYMVRQILNVLLMVITALLGAAVLIALIGVSNTLGLSVIERTRESALLRALGMQKGSLRLMLLVEALMLALAGVVVGVLMGAFFGWLGVRAVLRQAALHSPVQFGVNTTMTLGLIAVAVAAAALASILPGRRAARATPTQALAEE